jgi:hypothetical protein
MSVSSAPRSLRAVGGLLAAAVILTACSAASAPPQADRSPSPASTDSPEPTEATTPTDEPTPEPTDSHEAVALKYGLPPMPEAVRGVYSHPFSFWGGNWANLIELVETTELNAIVIDVKDEAGTLLWDIDHPYAAHGGADWRDNFDGFEERLQRLKDADGWAIARVSCFKDTRVAQGEPELAVQDVDGGVWIARKDFSWLNPYSEGAGQWCIDIGKAAIEAGFDEVQFDYIRFPNGGDGDVSRARFPGMPADRPNDQYAHPEAITRFLASAAEQLHEAGGWFSVDLFGLVTYNFSWNVDTTGQVLEEIAEHADVISLMVYPSHYGRGNYGLLPHPIEYPYETVWNAMQEAQMRTQGLHAKLRPWLEDFPAPWMGYPTHSAEHVREQIRATYENGIEGWLLWNAANRFTRDALEDTLELRANPDFRPPARTANPDPPPGEEQQTWPGMPPCRPYPNILQIGAGNLAGSVPPEPALPYDDPRLCFGVPDGERATATWQERQQMGTEEPTDQPTDATEPTEDPTD